MEIVEFVRVGGPYDGVGMYAITSEWNGWKAFFRWCYFSKARAEHVAARLTIDDARDFAANWTHTTDNCAASDYEKKLYEKRM